MSTQQPLIKRHNHKAHPCPNEKKIALLQELLEQHSDKSIAIISTKALKTFEVANNVVFVDDSNLTNDTYDLIISVDLPLDPHIYLNRLELTSSQAIILLDATQKQALYDIEKLLGRSINQEEIPDYSPLTNVKSQRVKREERAKKIADGTIRDNRPDRIREKKSSEKKRAGENRKGSAYVGKDENGKAKFSGKTGDRNHKYDGTPKSKDAKKSTSKKPSGTQKKDAPKRAPRKLSVGSIKPTQVTPETPKK